MDTEHDNRLGQKVHKQTPTITEYGDRDSDRVWTLSIIMLLTVWPWSMVIEYSYSDIV